MIILHISGFGLQGDPEYTSRASYDPIAQAFGGLMYANSNPQLSGLNPAAVTVADYYTALFAYGSALGAYIKRLKTGEGDSIDVNQYEAIVRCQAAHVMYDWNLAEGHPLRFTPGKINNSTAGYNGYKCKDGKYVMMLIFGPAMKRAFPVFGLEYGTEEWPAKMIYKDFDPEGKALDEAIQAYCDQHTADEVQAALTAVGAPAMQALTYEDMLEHPHYLARETITTRYSRGMDQDVKVANIYPRLKRNPGKFWRSTPAWGEDTNDILEDMGYTAEEIARLNESKAVHQGEVLD